MQYFEATAREHATVLWPCATCYRITLAASLVASHHIQDTICLQSGLPISSHLRLSTSTNIMTIQQIVTFSTADVGESLQRQCSFSLELAVI